MIKQFRVSRYDSQWKQINQLQHKKYAQLVAGASMRSTIKMANENKENKLADLEQLEDAKVALGHELHDSVNPLLCIAKLYIEQIETTDSRFSAAKSKAVDILLEAIETVRQISESNSIYEKLNCSFCTIVKGHLKRIRDLKRIRIIFSANDEERIDQLDNHYKLMFYRIIQEQLTNVLKYSKATVVRIKMHACENALTLKIADNGVGFDTAKVEGGIGFSSLRRRVNQLGGAFQIESSVGNGCSIYVNFKGCK